MVAAASLRDSLEEVRARLERIYSQHGAGPSAASSNGTNGSGSSSGSGAHAALVRSPPGEETVAEALRIQRLLGSNTEELRSVVRALNGEYVLPEAGGDLLRDGASEGAGAGWWGWWECGVRACMRAFWERGKTATGGWKVAGFQGAAGCGFEAGCWW